SREVAVKFLLNAVDADDPGFQAFLVGARAAAAVRHLGLTAIHHADVVEDIPYLVMEYVAGPSAAELLAAHGALPLAPALALMLQVTDAVAELHEHGIVHRDIKPSNVLIDSNGRAYVTDFGLTCLRRDGDSRVAGTPAYMAPEMFHGQVSPRSDVFALGVM